jgi:hypothetical protein
MLTILPPSRLKPRARRLGLVSRDVAKSIQQPASSLQTVTASRFRRAAPAAGRHHAGRAETTLGSAGLAAWSQAVGHHFFDYRAGVAVRRQSAEQGQERRHQAEAVAGTIHSIENRSGEKLASQSIRWYNQVIPI